MTGCRKDFDATVARAFAPFDQPLLPVLQKKPGVAVSADCCVSQVVWRFADESNEPAAEAKSRWPEEA